MGNDNLNKLLPSISVSNESSTFTFNSMPYWEGVKKKSGITRTLPFVLTATNDSLIKQITSEQVITDVINAYQLNEYAFITHPPGSSEWADVLGQSQVDVVKQMLGKIFPKNILEIGGGSTWVANKLRKHYNPLSYTIVDPSVKDTDEGVKVILDYFPNSQIANLNFDLILGFNVLEHVPDPLNFLHSIRKQIDKNGKVILVFPDCNKQLLQGDLNVLVHEHLTYFTETSFRWLAFKAGFSILSLTSENDTFSVLLEKTFNQFDINKKLNQHKLIADSANAIQNLFFKRYEEINSYLIKNQQVAFHGATAGLNTFLYITGLGQHPNIRLYDGDSSKEGFYLPACASRIMSPSDKSYIKNSLLVISAMSFFDEIKQSAVKKYNFNKSRVISLTGNRL